MSQEQADRAIEQLYGDASTRDELTDDEALVLLKWGEDQIRQLAAQNLDDAQFDEALTHLYKLITRVNRFTARRANLLPEEQHESLDRIAASAQAVAGFVPSAQAAAPPVFDAYLQQQGGLDNIASIQALTALIAPAAQAAAPAAADPKPEIPVHMLYPQTPLLEEKTASHGVSETQTAITKTDTPAQPAPPTTGDDSDKTQQ